MELSEPLTNYFRLTPRQMVGLKKLGITTARDLLFYFPVRYEGYAGAKTIQELKAGERATIRGEVVSIKAQKTWKKRLNIADARVRDHTGTLRVTWFNQPYIASQLPPESHVLLTGRISEGKQGLFLANPTFEKIDPGTLLSIFLPAEQDREKLLPVYPETIGVTSRWLAFHIEKLLKELPAVPETLPEHVLKTYHLPAIKTALRAIHAPKTRAEADAARKRFSFEEVFVIQLSRQQARKKLEEEPSLHIPYNKKLMADFTASLPYSLTNAQKKAINDILEDFEKTHPMARLLEGDVGSGKTIVAASAALAAIKAGYQVAFMAPTEILALQHFHECIERLKPFRVSIGLLTGSEAKKFPSKSNPGSPTHIAKSQLLKWVTDGTIQLLVGTHALIQDRVRFKKLGFVVIDEQHRYGTSQRATLLRRKDSASIPHLLSMTATPIPRTLALTMYSDLDLSVLDEMPPGRKPIATKIVRPLERPATYDFIRNELAAGGQAFVICPKIEDQKPDDTKTSFVTAAKLDWSGVKSVKTEHKKLSETIFPEFTVGMLHGKMKPKDKEATLALFREGKLHMLVSTSVVEVGVDIPKASIMMIEGGERFGLAQLHQFRGRVGRRGQNAYCFVFTSENAGDGLRRLKALEEAKSGFALAEYDLEFRGAGELAGERQSGLSDVGMDALKNLKMVEAARSEAQRIINEDPELKNYPLLQERVKKIKTLHLE